MRNNRFQNHVSESSVTLPLCMVIGTLVWFWNSNTLCLEYDLSSIMALLLAMATTYIVMETANAYSLLRIRSRMITTVWVLGISLISSTHTLNEGWVAALAIAGSYYVMFMAYQQHEAVIHVFHTFLLLAVAVLAIPQFVVFIPLYYWYLLVFLRCLTWRCFWAGAIGLALPLLIVLGWSIATDDYSFIWGRWENLLGTQLFQYEGYTLDTLHKEPEVLNIIFFSLLALIGIIHYLRNYYNDKIRTRMYLYIYVMQTMLCFLTIVFMPDQHVSLAPAFLICSSTMIAHFFALTGTLTSNLFFCLTIVVTILLLIINMGIWKY